MQRPALVKSQGGALCRTGAVGDYPLRLGQHSQKAVCIADVEQHALRHSARHFPRGKVHHEQGLPALYFTRVFPLFFHTHQNGALEFTKIYAKLYKLVGIFHILYSEDGAHADIQRIQRGDIHCRLYGQMLHKGASF